MWQNFKHNTTVDGKYTNIDCIDEYLQQNDAYSPEVNSKNQMCGSHLETERATFFLSNSRVQYTTDSSITPLSHSHVR